MGDIVDTTDELAEAARISETARLAGRSALSATTLAAAQAALAAVQGNDGGSALSEPAQDLRRIRTDAKLMPALEADLRTAQLAAEIFLGDALWVGFRTGLQSRSAGLPLTVALTDQDRQDLAGYPIHGFTAAEISAELARQLGREVDRALALPLTGGIDPATIPTALQAVAEAHAGRLADLVDEAHAVGVGAAVRVIGQALTGQAA